MTPWKVKIFTIFLFISPMPASAMSIEQAVKTGLTLHPQVRTAISKAQEAGIEVDITKGEYYPSLSVSGGPNNFSFNDITYDVTASQALYDWGRVKSRVDKASAVHKKLLDAVDVARDDAALDIIETYLDVLTAQKRVEVVKNYISRLKDIAAMTEARGVNGYMDRSETERTQLELARAEEQLSTENGTLLDAENQYQLLVGEKPQHLFDPHPTSLKQSISDKDLSEIIHVSPLLRVAQEEINLATAEVREAKSALLPQLNLEMSAWRRESGRRIQNDSTIGLRFRMDPIQGLSHFQRPNVAQQRVNASKGNFDVKQRDIQRQMRSLFDMAETLKWREASLIQQVNTSEQVSGLYREQFEIGHREVIDLLSVQREGFEIERQLATLKVERQRIEYRAAAQVGLLTQLMEDHQDHGNKK